MSDTREESLLSDYTEFYIKGFRTDDVSLIDEVVQYPLTHISNGVSRVCDQFPINPSSLKRDKSWDHSRDWHFDVLSINDLTAHASASAIRCRADGSAIERVDGFYVFVRVGGRWRMTVLAEMTSPP